MFKINSRITPRRTAAPIPFIVNESQWDFNELIKLFNEEKNIFQFNNNNLVPSKIIPLITLLNVYIVGNLSPIYNTTNNRLETDKFCLAAILCTYTPLYKLYDWILNTPLEDVLYWIYKQFSFSITTDQNLNNILKISKILFDSLGIIHHFNHAIDDYLKSNEYLRSNEYGPVSLFTQIYIHKMYILNIQKFLDFEFIPPFYIVREDRALMLDLQVRQSAIQNSGNGIFTLKHLNGGKDGLYICPYEGEPMTNDQYKEQVKKDEPNYTGMRRGVAPFNPSLRRYIVYLLITNYNKFVIYIRFVYIGIEFKYRAKKYIWRGIIGTLGCTINSAESEEKANVEINFNVKNIDNKNKKFYGDNFVELWVKPNVIIQPGQELLLYYLTPQFKDLMTKCAICGQTYSHTNLKSKKYPYDPMLLCDNCNKGYHLLCLNLYDQPTVEEILDENKQWFCQNCVLLEEEKNADLLEEPENELWSHQWKPRKKQNINEEEKAIVPLDADMMLEESPEAKNAHVRGINPNRTEITEAIIMENLNEIDEKKGLQGASPLVLPFNPSTYTLQLQQDIFQLFNLINFKTANTIKRNKDNFFSNGYVIYDKSLLLGVLNYYTEGSQLHVTYLFIHPDYQKHGYGKLLMNQLISDKGKNYDITIVPQDLRLTKNRTAKQAKETESRLIQFYSKFGFERDRTNQNGYVRLKNISTSWSQPVYTLAMIKEIKIYMTAFSTDIEAINYLKTNKVNYAIINLYKLKSMYSLSNYLNYPIKAILTSVLYDDRLSNNILNIPTSARNLTFTKNFNQPIDNLPNFITNLTLGTIFDQTINKLPKSLTSLTLGHDFDQPIEKLPESLINLTLGEDFNQPIDKLPQSLTSLTVGDYFNQPIDLLPKSLTFLTLGHGFNQPIDKLPNSLTSLTLGNDFIQPINQLPQSLINLTLGAFFNQPIDQLPEFLTHLELGDDFDQLVDHLPQSLTNLTLGDNFNQPIDQLPKSLTHLTLGPYFNKPIDQLPKSLTHLILEDDFNQPINQLPESLTHLTLGFFFNQPIDQLPKSLTHLILGKNFNRPIDKLPNSLTHITLGLIFNQSIDHLSTSLTHLIIGYYFNRSIDYLPNSIISLTIGHAFNQPINYLPRSLMDLTLGNSFDQRIDQLPSALIALNIGNAFDQPIDHLPTSLTTLVIGNGFNEPIDHLPDSLNTLSLGQDFNNSINHLPKSLINLTLGNYFQTSNDLFRQFINNKPHFLTHITVIDSYDLVSTIDLSNHQPTRHDNQFKDDNSELLLKFPKSEYNISPNNENSYFVQSKCGLACDDSGAWYDFHGNLIRANPSPMARAAPLATPSHNNGFTEEKNETPDLNQKLTLKHETLNISSAIDIINSGALTSSAMRNKPVDQLSNMLANMVISDLLRNKTYPGGDKQPTTLNWFYQMTPYDISKWANPEHKQFLMNNFSLLKNNSILLNKIINNDKIDIVDLIELQKGSDINNGVLLIFSMDIDHEMIKNKKIVFYSKDKDATTELTPCNPITSVPIVVTPFSISCDYLKYVCIPNSILLDQYQSIMNRLIPFHKSSLYTIYKWRGYAPSNPS